MFFNTKVIILINTLIIKRMKYLLVSLNIMLILLFVSCGKGDNNIATNSNPQVEPGVFFIEENSPNGTIVGKVIASDKDKGQTLHYDIVHGNIDDAFLISEQDGTIRVNKEEKIDFEANSNFILDVEVSDNKGGVTSVKIVVVINNIEISEQGLELYMPFDYDVSDKSLKFNNGEDYTSGNYVDGIKNKALDFNGFSDFVKLSKTIESDKGLSFSFWLKTRGAYEGQNNGAIISKYDMGGNRCFFVWSFDIIDGVDLNRLSAAFFKYGYSGDVHDHVKSYMKEEDLKAFPDKSLWEVSKQKELELNRWTHCVVNVTENYIETWLDGELCVKKKREHETYYSNDYEPIIIGNIHNGGTGSNNHFNGVLDELRIYSRSLSEREIRTLLKE